MDGNEKETRAQMYARVVQQSLRRYGALDLPTLLVRSMLDTEAQVKQGMHYSRRSLDDDLLANEIICTTKDLNGTYVYFLASSDTEAEDYEIRRRVIALGHIQSVICLEEKRAEKWPNPQRAAAIKMLEMAHSLLSTAP